MFSILANIFGSLLGFIYNFIGNYGLSIICFSVIIKLILLPMSIKQQKAMKQANKLQEEMKKIQDKYGNDTEKINQEVMNLYKKTGMNPFSGCFISLIQFALIISVFVMVRSPLTYVKKIDKSTIEKYNNQLKEINSNYDARYPEISILKEFGNQDKNIYMNMDFIGIDLSSIPTDNNNIKTWIIPILYVITSILAMKLNNTSNTGNNKEEKKKTEAEEQMQQMNKTMMLFVPIMSISIAIIAPLGLTLYWFISNILSIIERIFIGKFQKQQEEVV